MGKIGGCRFLPSDVHAFKIDDWPSGDFEEKVQVSKNLGSAPQWGLSVICHS